MGGSTNMIAFGFQRARRTASLLVAVLLLASACGGGGDDDGGSDTTNSDPAATSTSGPTAGGEATILLFSEIATIDPVRMNGSGSGDGMRGYALYGGLLLTDPETHQAEPLLAESFTADEAATVWTLALRPDVAMSDGSPFDAAAVKANWDRIKDLANRSPSLAAFFPVQSIEVADPLTVVLTLSAPNAHLDKAIARTGANYIASAKAISEGVDLTSNAVGAGPYLLDSWVRDDRMVLKRNPTWAGVEGPYLDRITYRILTDEDPRIDTFVTGQADAFFTATPASVSRATDAVDGATYPSVDVNTGQAYVFNTTEPPFDDVRVRTAFAQGVDWQALAEVVYGEGAVAPYNFTLEGTRWYDEQATLPDFDRDSAQELFNAYSDDHGGAPVRIALTTYQQSLDQARAQFIQASLTQLDNVEVEVQVGDVPTNSGKVIAGDYNISSWGFPILDPDPGLYGAVHSTSFTNFSKYKNPEVDALLDKARITTDDDERKVAYDEVWEILATDLPFYPYLKTTNGYVTSPDIEGEAVTLDGILRVDLLWRLT
jgi:peptide/nickel transport system substrate-binding protein